MTWRSYEILKRPEWSDLWFEDGHLSVRPLETPIEAYARQNTSEDDIALVPQINCGDRSFLLLR